MHAREVLETCLYVNDIAAARKFYTEVLGLHVVDEQPDRHLFMRCGARMLLLFLPDASSVPGSMLPTHGAHGPGHVAFAATQAELADWRTHFKKHGVAIEQEVEWPQRGTSLYFRDPANNCLEIATPRLWGLDAAETL
jgi:catechol 2,3-dioxygenase-like lactoylglutathione lyase family enzyme